MRLVAPKNKYLATVIAIVTTLAILVVFADSVGGSPVIPASSEMTTTTSTAVPAATSEISQSFTVSGNSHEIITVSPNGIVSVTKEAGSSTVQAATAPSAHTTSPATASPDTTPPTNETTAPTSSPTSISPSPAPTNTDPTTPSCAPCGTHYGTRHDVMCPMYCRD